MKYLLDTNICIYIIKQKPPQVIKRLQRMNVHEVAISVMTLSELEYGVEKSSRPERNRMALSEFLAPINIIPYEDNAALCYGKIRNVLEKKGEPIGAMDLLIAAHAMALDLVLVTNNEREFKKIKGLRVENWV